METTNKTTNNTTTIDTSLDLFEMNLDDLKSFAKNNKENVKPIEDILQDADEKENEIDKLNNNQKIGYYKTLKYNLSVIKDFNKHETKDVKLYFMEIETMEKLSILLQYTDLSIPEILDKLNCKTFSLNSEKDYLRLENGTSLFKLIEIKKSAVSKILKLTIYKDETIENEKDKNKDENILSVLNCSNIPFLSFPFSFRCVSDTNIKEYITKQYRFWVKMEKKEDKK